MTYKLKVAPINANNFLRWYPNQTPTVANSTLANGLHNGYLYKWRSQPDLMPVLVGDTLTMYTNFDTNTYLDGKFVKVVEEASCGTYTVIDDVTKYDISATGWGTNNAKITLTIPVTNTDNNKKVRLAIVGEPTAEGFTQTTKFTSNYVSGGVYGVKQLLDGNFILYGDFSVIGETTTKVAVINVAGAIVTSYAFGIGFNGWVNQVVQQPDGKLIFVGDFTEYNGTPINRIVRINVDGTIDATFNVGTGADRNISLLEIDSLGNVYIGSASSFFYNGSGTGQRIYKLNSIGARDVAYVPTSFTPRAFKIHTDDKLLVATSGSSGIRRLNTDSTADGTFTSSLSGGAVCNAIELDVSGNIYVGLTTGMDKLLSDGSQDVTFTSTITETILGVKIVSGELYVAGINTADILDLNGLEVSSITVTFSVGNFIPYGANYLLTSGTNIKINSGGLTTFAEVAEVFVENVEYVSNNFLVGQFNAKNINNTHLISFYNKSNIYNYEWADFDELVDDYYQIRVSSSIVGITYPSEKEIYTEATTGKPRVTRAINNKQYNFEIYYALEDHHDAVSTVSNFKYFGINGKQYIVEEYEVEFLRNLNIFKGTLTIKDVEFNRRVSTCLT
jgi:hypothetical protein